MALNDTLLSCESMHMTELEELFSWLRLVHTPGVGPQAFRKLLIAFGSAPAIFKQSIYTLEQIVSSRQAQAIAQEPPDFRDACNAFENWLEAKPWNQVIPLGHPHYPKNLLEIADPPLLLYACGNLELLNSPALAIVGSRQPTPQGKETTQDFAQTLSQQGITIVSGLAQGIDGASHAAAIKEQGRTIAVLGTGIDRVYPASHHALTHQIAQDGLLLSEYPLGTPPVAHNFPKRNRIIAGLALGTLVVEATLHSGSLITAKLSAEAGKDVFAIPGSIHSPQSKGCHWLIRQGAKLVETAQDILDELRLPTLQPPKPSPSPTQSTTQQTVTSYQPQPGQTSDSIHSLGHSSEQDVIIDAIGEDPTSFEAIAMRTGIDTAALQAGLLSLELDQQIARLPGHLYQRLHCVTK